MKTTLLLISALCLVRPALGDDNTPPPEGLVLWLDAAHVVTNEAGQVTQWSDRSARGHHATGAAGPRVIQDQGRPMLRFGDGGAATKLLLPELRETRGPLTLFVVARRTDEQAGGGKWQRLIAPEPDRGPKPGAFLLTLPPNSDRTNAFPAAIFTSIQRNIEPGPLALGGQGAQALRADVAEVLVYDHAFDDPREYERVVDYLSAIWKVQLQRGGDGWVREGPIPESPARQHNDLPLTDQSNAGHWQPMAALTDEFDGPALDAAKWWDHNPTWYGRPPAPFQAKNVVITNGELQLTLRKDPDVAVHTNGSSKFGGYSSATIAAKTAVAYGCFEIRAKVARCTPTSSWWFMGGARDTQGREFRNEIDIFELPAGAAGHEHRFGMNLHVFREGDDHSHWANWGNWEAPFRWADDFHTITLEWSPAWIRYYVDGHCIRTTQNIAWHAPLQMIFDMEIMDWLPFPKDDEFPATYRVDYVRTWTRPDWTADPTLKPHPDPAKGP